MDFDGHSTYNALLLYSAMSLAHIYAILCIVPNVHILHLENRGKLKNSSGYEMVL